MSTKKWDLATVDEVLRMIEHEAKKVKSNPINSAATGAIDELLAKLNEAVNVMRFSSGRSRIGGALTFLNLRRT